MQLKGKQCLETPIGRHIFAHLRTQVVCILPLSILQLCLMLSLDNELYTTPCFYSAFHSGLVKVCFAVSVAK